MLRTLTTYGLGGYDPAKPNGNVISVLSFIERGLGTDRSTIPADGVTPATLHYAGDETSVAVDINGAPLTLALTPDPDSGLNVGTLQLTAPAPGTIEVLVAGVHHLTIIAI